MDNERVAAELAKLSTAVDYQTQILKELKEQDKETKKDVDSLKQSRSRLRGILVGLGILGGSGAAGHTDWLQKFFGQ